MAPRREMNRTSGVARRKAPSAQYNDSPFKGSDPFSGIASFIWRLPGAIASGRTLTGRKVTGEEWSALAATSALTAAGIYAGTRTSRTAPRTPGARPMTTAERSAAVTRAGRTGVGKIGTSIKPKRETSDWAYDPEAGEMRFEPTHFDTPYDEVYSKAAAIYSKRTGKDNPGVFRVISGPLVNTRYRGFTETVNIPDAYENPWTGQRSGADFDFITGAMKKTLDWKATRAPLRRTASVKRRVKK